MPLVTLKEVLVPAKENGYAIGAFTFWSFDSAHAIVNAAEEMGMPVILQCGPGEFPYEDIKNLVTIAKLVANKTPLSIVLHLDHGNSCEMALCAINEGFTSVMIDSSNASFQENIIITKKVVAMAKDSGVSVEAELGRLSGAEASQNVSDEESNQTDPDEAKIFVEETGIDALAVAIGTVHGFYKFKPNINITRLKCIAEKVSIPLVLHGGSGTPIEKIVEAINCGVAKINVFSEFVSAYGKSFIKSLNKPDFNYSNSISDLFTAARTAGQDLIASKINLFKCKK